MARARVCRHGRGGGRNACQSTDEGEDLCGEGGGGKKEDDDTKMVLVDGEEKIQKLGVLYTCVHPFGFLFFLHTQQKKKWGRNAPAREGPRGYIGLAEVGLFHADAPPLETLLVVVFSVWTLEAPGVDGRAEPSLL